MIGVLVGVSVFFGLLAVRPPTLVDTVGRHLGSEGDRVHRRRAPRGVPAPVLVGGAVGLLFAPGGSVVGLMLGSLCGAFFVRARAASAMNALRRRLGRELPTVADLCALYVLSGDSVVAALRRFQVDATGVAASEITSLLDRVDAGVGFPEAAREAARDSAHPDGARLYEMLAQAHRSGARLVDTLEMFAADRRAALEREITVEGGRRALTGYGPILGLMIPTTLVFLMYPTLAGLDALSTTR